MNKDAAFFSNILILTYCHAQYQLTLFHSEHWKEKNIYQIWLLHTKGGKVWGRGRGGKLASFTKTTRTSLRFTIYDQSIHHAAANFIDAVLKKKHQNMSLFWSFRTIRWRTRIPTWTCTFSLSIMLARSHITYANLMFPLKAYLLISFLEVPGECITSLAGPNKINLRTLINVENIVI